MQSSLPQKQWEDQSQPNTSRLKYHQTNSSQTMDIQMPILPRSKNVKQYIINEHLTQYQTSRPINEAFDDQREFQASPTAFVKKPTKSINLLKFKAFNKSSYQRYKSQKKDINPQNLNNINVSQFEREKSNNSIEIQLRQKCLQIDDSYPTSDSKMKVSQNLMLQKLVSQVKQKSVFIDTKQNFTKNAAQKQLNSPYNLMKPNIPLSTLSSNKRNFNLQLSPLNLESKQKSSNSPIQKSKFIKQQLPQINPEIINQSPQSKNKNYHTHYKKSFKNKDSLRLQDSIDNDTTLIANKIAIQDKMQYYEDILNQENNEKDLLQQINQSYTNFDHLLNNQNFKLDPNINSQYELLRNNSEDEEFSYRNNSHSLQFGGTSLKFREQANKSNLSSQRQSQQSSPTNELKVRKMLTSHSPKSKRSLVPSSLDALIKERERIQQMLRNKYYWNNYAMPLPESLKKAHKLRIKLRFPLYEMVVEDGDFQQRLKRRQQDLVNIQENIITNRYNREDGHSNSSSRKDSQLDDYFPMRNSAIKGAKSVGRQRIGIENMGQIGNLEEGRKSTHASNSINFGNFKLTRIGYAGQKEVIMDGEQERKSRSRSKRRNGDNIVISDEYAINEQIQIYSHDDNQMQQTNSY